MSNTAQDNTNTHCSRCKKPILCTSESISTCPCTKVKLSEDTLDYLDKTVYKCLCNNCLLALDQKVELAGKQTKNNIEGIHYTIENGLLVFTELSHIQRGYCCESGCKNCAYGFEMKK